MALSPFQIKADIHLSATYEMLRQAPNALMEGLRKLMQTTVEAIKVDLIAKHLTGGTTTTRLARRHGTLIRSLRSRVTGNKLETLSGMVGFVDPGGVYATTHVFGTMSKGGSMPDIRSQSGRYMPIPLYGSGAFTAGGKLRGGPQSGKFRDTFIRRMPSGQLIIFGKASGDRRPNPLFVLKKAVSVPPRVDMFGVAQEHIAWLEKMARTALPAMIARNAPLG